MDTREDKTTSNPIQSDLTFKQRLHFVFFVHVPILLQMVFTAPRQWLYEGSTDGIYMVAGHRDAGACSSHQKLSHLALYIRVRVHNATNKYVPWKCVIRLYIVRPYTTGVGALLIHLSRHSFA